MIPPYFVLLAIPILQCAYHLGLAAHARDDHHGNQHDVCMDPAFLSLSIRRRGQRSTWNTA